MDCSEVDKCIYEINIIFTDNSNIKELNSTFRGKNKSTDVLSFSYIENLTEEDLYSSNLNFQNNILGELVISLETAYNQCQRYNNSFSDEIIRLLVHGIHHLLGFDHEKVGSLVAQKMRRSERKIFTKLKKENYILGIYNE